MKVALDQIELQYGQADEDPHVASSTAFPVHAGVGSASTAVVYFVRRTGTELGRHTDSAEEILLVLEGEAEVEIEDKTLRLTAEQLVVVPAGVRHNVVNVSASPVRVVGFFSGSAVIANFDVTYRPDNTKVFVIGAPELALEGTQ